MNNKPLLYTKKPSGSVLIDAVFNSLLILFVILALSVCFFCFSHIYFDVKGTSMEPNIYERSSTYVGNGCYVTLNAAYTYGDIVVANGPNNYRIIKRVIALGGDKIGYYYNEQSSLYQLVIIKNGEDAELIDESYITATIPESERLAILQKNEISYTNFIDNNIDDLVEIEFSGQSVKFLTIASNEVFLLGDNRETSVDCSRYGALDATAVFGKVILIVEQGDINVWQILKYNFGF